MEDDNNNLGRSESILHQIRRSQGAKFLDQIYSRSFSLNIFQMNAVALIEAILHVRDPDRGLFLMSEGQRDEGRQAYRELNRHLHNFVTAAFTLVDHTRVFMNKRYGGTVMLDVYQEQVKKDFANDPLSQFVQGLRNFIVHRGAPDTEMFVEINNNEGQMVAESGIRLGTVSLLEYDGWNAPAKKYIRSVGKFVDLKDFALEYLTRVNRFHAGLEENLRRFHAADLAELARLQIQQAEIEQAGAGVHDPKIESVQETPALSDDEAFIAQIREPVREASLAIQAKIQEFTFRSTKSRFPSERYVTASITDEQMIGKPILWTSDENGVRVFVYIFDGDKSFGLTEDDHQALDPLIDLVLSQTWAKERLSRKFVEQQFVSWSQRKFYKDENESFDEALVKAASEKIEMLEVWLPIAHLEIEEAVMFGPAKIAPITRDMMDQLENKALAGHKEQGYSIRQLFERIRKEFQGSAAVVLTMEAEPIFAGERALLIGRDVVDLIRFFSPGAPLISLLCPTALAGVNLIPGSTVMIVSDIGLSSMTEGSTVQNIARWQIWTRQLMELNERGFSAAGQLVNMDRLTDFERSLRSGLITYSRGTTFSDPIDRLDHTLAALEGVLLKHRMEPVEFNVADRMGFMRSRFASDRAAIAQSVRHAYRTKKRDRTTALSSRDAKELLNFTYEAYAVLVIALGNKDLFKTSSDFVAAVDRLGVEQS